MNALLSIALLAGIIAGETGDLCELNAKIGVAWVAHNRAAAGIPGGWYGLAEPREVDRTVAELYHRLTDPTAGALFMVSGTDLEQREVATFLRGRQRTARFECAGDTYLEAWK